MTEEKKPEPIKQSLVRRFLATLGPGVITGAADDDPSGIATYSIAGAQFGTLFLWAALLTWPLMAAVQMMCARIGMVTGKGLGGALRDRFPKPVLIVICLALLAANTLNIAADLAGMADAAAMLTGFNSHIFVVVFGVTIAAATLWLRYQRFASLLKWLSLSLGAYIATALLLHPHWLSVLRETFTVSLPKTSGGWSMLVAILGTTISPYLFFWQASQEVEEERALGRRMLIRRQGATRRELGDRRLDVGTGTFFSNLVMFFIILTTALTLHAHGKTHIETSRQAAEALLPVAGRWASTLYTLGIFGVGCLAIPTLGGSAAYAFAETFRWHEGLDRKPRRAREFYSIVVLSTALGILLDFLHVNAIRILYGSAVINGLLAPFLLVAILILASDAKTMHGQPSSRLSRIVVGLTTVLMFAAAIGMFVF
ncbi:MAG TPA: divalent metal cation transporter [Thermoanaerobaculia bacterium]|jgi:Mn2+/Fe2+ NRAMP family transporter|nr:divalent metal cation transporter [Thermoanaerobaculia bacterium]